MYAAPPVLKNPVALCIIGIGQDSLSHNASGVFSMKDYSTSGEFLQDVSSTGRERPWNERKRQSIKVSSSYFRLGYLKKADRMRACGDYLEFKRYNDNTLKLWHASFCKARLCPMCAWRRSLLIYHQVREIMDYFNGKYEFLFLTLTVKNCMYDEIGECLVSLKAGLNRLFRTKEVDAITKGFFYAFEITVNHENLTFHPHIHLCIAVNKSYFKHGYLKQSEWTDLWKKSCKLDYIPIVHIEKFSGDIEKSVAEAAKYTVKPADLVYSDEFLQDVVIQSLDDGIYQKRLIGFRGCFLKARKALQLEDVEKADLVIVDGKSDDIEEFTVERYFFQTGINLGVYRRI